MASEMASADACAELGRRVFHDRVGRHFLDEAPEAFPKPRPCAVCGEPLSFGFSVGKEAQCLAQRSIAKNRPESHVKKERAPKLRKDGSPAVVRSYGSFNELRRAVLVTADRSVVIANVKPVGPLPSNMTFTHDGGDDSFGLLYEALLDPGIALPALLVIFDRRCDGAFVLTESRSGAAQCGGAGVKVLDLVRVSNVLAMAETLGREDFERLLRLKAQMVDGLEDEGARDAYLELLDRLPGTARASVPHPDDAVLQTVRTVLKTRRQNAAA